MQRTGAAGEAQIRLWTRSQASESGDTGSGFAELGGPLLVVRRQRIFKRGRVTEGEPPLCRPQGVRLERMESALAVRFAWCCDCSDIVSMDKINSHADLAHPGTWTTVAHHTPPLFATDEDVNTGDQLLQHHAGGATSADREKAGYLLPADTRLERPD
jgi:hypothetical protein